jgi:hypothetical protein
VDNPDWRLLVQAGDDFSLLLGDRSTCQKRLAAISPTTARAPTKVTW